MVFNKINSQNYYLSVEIFTLCLIFKFLISPLPTRVGKKMILPSNSEEIILIKKERSCKIYLGLKRGRRRKKTISLHFRADSIQQRCLVIKEKYHTTFNITHALYSVGIIIILLNILFHSFIGALWKIVGICDNACKVPQSK